MPHQIPLNTEQRFQNSAWGMQDQIVLMAMPAGVSPALRGVALVNAGTLNIAGDYHCLIPLTGEQYAWLKLTIAAASSVAFDQAEYNGV